MPGEQQREVLTFICTLPIGRFFKRSVFIHEVQFKPKHKDLAYEEVIKTYNLCTAYNGTVFHCV